MSLYSNKELKTMTKHLMVILNDPQVSMATVPRKDGTPELAVIKKDTFTDLVTENEQIRKWAFLACQGIAELSLTSPDLGKNISGLVMMAVDAGQRFFGMTEDMTKELGEELAGGAELSSPSGEKDKADSYQEFKGRSEQNV